MDQQDRRTRTRSQTLQGQRQNASLSPLERATRAYQTLERANAEILQAMSLADWYRYKFELQLVELNKNLLQRRAIFDDFNQKSMLWDRVGRGQSELTEDELQRLEANAERYREMASHNIAAQTYFLCSVVRTLRDTANEDEQRIKGNGNLPQIAQQKEVVAHYSAGHEIAFYRNQVKRQQDAISWYGSQEKYHQDMVNWLEQQPNGRLPLQTGLRDHPLLRRPSQILEYTPVPGVVPALYLDTAALESGSPTAPPPMVREIPKGGFQMQFDTASLAAGFGSSNSPWTEKDEMWLVINAMYNKSADELSRIMPGGRSANSITRRMTELRVRRVIPNNWTLKALSHTDHPWTIEEDIELMRWHASGREVLDASIFHFYDRSGTAAFRRAEFLVQDKELERKAKEIEAAQGEALLEMDENGDTGMTETQGEVQATEELHQAILRSLAARPPMNLW